MKILRKSILFIIAVILISGNVLFCQEETVSIDLQEAMKAYENLMAVNENHEYFKQFAGEWDMLSKVWMNPGSEPSVSESTVAAKLVLDGRFLLMHFKGSMLGKPFEGIQITGYDNVQKKYITFWIDNSSTAFYLTSGTRDEEGILTETAEWPDPLSGSMMKVKAVSRLTGPDSFTYEMYMIMPDGSEFKSMENRMSRKK